MKIGHTILLLISLLLTVGVVSVYLIPKNTPLAHYLNKNTLDLEVAEGLQEEKVKIKLSIWATEFQDSTIVENGSVNSIPKGYGENNWALSYGDNAHGAFRHFKTNNWHDHHYAFYFYQEGEQLLCDVEIFGPDERDKETIILDYEVHQPQNHQP